MREGHGNDDTVNAVFRAVHSVKGGAGIFGFKSLVEFAHVFETVLDTVRRGSLAATADVVDVLCRQAMSYQSRRDVALGEAIPPDFGGESPCRLSSLLNATKRRSVADDSPARPISRISISHRCAPRIRFPGDVGGLRTYTIVFRPKPELLKHANEPLYIVRELRKLGELDLIAETDSLPPLLELECDRPYIGWTGTLRTEATRAQIDEVFEFVANDCELNIEEQIVSSPGGDVEAIDSPPPIDVPAAPVSEGSAPKAVPSAPGGTPEPAAAARPPTAKPAPTTTRVELERIDRVVNMVGELVIAQAMLEQIVRDLPEATSGRLSQILEEVVHHTRELKDSVMSMRAQPVGSVFQRMPRLVRELSTKTSKKIRLEMAGEMTEVDRSIIERLGDPLDEYNSQRGRSRDRTPADRLAANKHDEGTIRLSAEHRGGRIVIEVSDDGAGIDSERVLKKAREKGLVSADAVLTEDEMNNLVFLPGFSTAETISDISGRGVGMDVVRRNIQEIGGRIILKSVRGRGMTIQLALPLTLAVMDGMVIKVGKETYVMPLSTIVECLRPTRSDVNNLIGTRGMLQLRGDLLPLVSLGDLLDIGSAVGVHSRRRHHHRRGRRFAIWSGCR